MRPDGRDDGRDDRRLRLQEGSEAERDARRSEASPELVFDFTGLGAPDLCDLSLVLTARLQSGPDDNVWVRALPTGTWRVLQALGLDHLFRPYPGAEDMPN
ncbi:MAG: hypothetical protein RJQ04_15960 [Longimicrobiales bacterium]